MRLEETEEVLQGFLDDVIKQAKRNLKDKNINASRSLSNSFKSEVKVNPNSIEATIEAEDYLPFIDLGVKGTKSGKSLGGFKYTNKKPPIRFLRTWIKQKSRRFRQRDLNRQAFAVQNTIFKRGIRPTKFFSDPFEDEFKKLPPELIEAYGLDLDRFIDFVLKD